MTEEPTAAWPAPLFDDDEAAEADDQGAAPLHDEAPVHEAEGGHLVPTHGDSALATPAHEAEGGHETPAKDAEPEPASPANGEHEHEPAPDPTAASERLHEPAPDPTPAPTYVAVTPEQMAVGARRAATGSSALRPMAPKPVARARSAGGVPVGRSRVASRGRAVLGLLLIIVFAAVALAAGVGLTAAGLSFALKKTLGG